MTIHHDMHQRQEEIKKLREEKVINDEFYGPQSIGLQNSARNRNRDMIKTMDNRYQIEY